jgi:hypothetical protein
MLIPKMEPAFKWCAPNQFWSPVEQKFLKAATTKTSEHANGKSGETSSFHSILSSQTCSQGVYFIWLMAAKKTKEVTHQLRAWEFWWNAVSSERKCGAKSNSHCRFRSMKEATQIWRKTSGCGSCTELLLFMKTAQLLLCGLFTSQWWRDWDTARDLPHESFRKRRRSIKWKMDIGGANSLFPNIVYLHPVAHPYFILFHSL